MTSLRCRIAARLLLSPVAGALVDHWDRRRTLILSDLVAAITSALLLELLWDESRNLLEVCTSTR